MEASSAMKAGGQTLKYIIIIIIIIIIHLTILSPLRLFSKTLDQYAHNNIP
jgi:hypothetical protein